MKFFWRVDSGQSGTFCTTKTETVVLYVRIEKAPVENGKIYVFPDPDPRNLASWCIFFLGTSGVTITRAF